MSSIDYSNPKDLLASLVEIDTTSSFRETEEDKEKITKGSRKINERLREIVSKTLSHLSPRLNIVVGEGDDVKIQNLIVTFDELKDRPFKMTFNSHYDVVSVGDPEKWDSDPFKLKERDGFLYGRGTNDNKGGIVTQIIGLSQMDVKDIGVNPVLTFVGEEEVGGDLGSAFIVDTRPDLVKADIHVILDGRLEKLWFGCFSITFLKALFEGKTGHPGHEGSYINPIDPALTVLPKFRDELNRFFKEQVMKKAEEMGLREKLSKKDFERATYINHNITNFFSGTGVTNQVPGESIIKMDGRLSPIIAGHDNKERVIGEIMRIWNSIIDKEGIEAKAALEVFTYMHGFLTDPTNENVEFVKDCMRSVLGDEPVAEISIGGVDARLFPEPSVTTGCVSAKNNTGHQINERLSWKELRDGIKLMEKMLKGKNKIKKIQKIRQFST